MSDPRNEECGIDMARSAWRADDPVVESWYVGRLTSCLPKKGRWEVEVI
jgi:hypothetical protein